MNTYAGRRIFKSVIYNRNSHVYFVASWACEVTLILKQKGLLHCFFV